MNLDETSIELASKAIEKGERSRILMELLLSNLGYTIQDEIDLFKELKKTQDEYNEAIKMMALIRFEAMKAKKKDTKKR